MKRQPRILAGTALGLLMASAPLAAAPLSFGTGQSGGQDLSGARILLVQDCPEGQECAPNSRRQQRQQQGEEGKPRQQRREQGGGEQQQEAPQRQRREQPQQEQAPEPRPRVQREQPEPEAPRQQRRQQPAEEAPAERPRREQRQQEQAPEAQRPRAQPDEAPQRPRREQRQEPEAQQEPAPRPQRAPAETQPEPRPAQPAQEQPAPRPQAEQPAEPNNNRRREQQQEQPSGTEAPAPRPRPAEPAPEAAPTPPDAPTPARPRPAEGGQPTPSERPALPGSGEQGEHPALPGAGEQGQRPGLPDQPQGEAPRPEGEAPLLDSQKERPGRDGQRPDRQRPDGQRPDGQRPDGQRPDGQERPDRPRVDQGPPPTDDRAAQEAIRPERVRPVEEEQGRRIDRRPELRDRERRDGADIVRELGDRLIIQFGGQTRVESSDRPRMTRDARDVYYEELPRGRTRETIVRANGNQIVTVRNRYGDIVQRSRITPDGREYILSYVDEDNYDRIDDGRDAGYDLPPLQLNIPREQYILESEPGRTSDDYYTFLEQPPVERVERLYSVDEVKRSARVRDIARRIDLDTLTFEFGSDTIPEAEITKLEGVAQAMERLLEKNPAETFLIEGHTDAVGSDVANLALSDRRAEAVANALTNVFAIPPENLSTQGYGEQYLKVNTTAPERENRRVAIRRITALVAPMASAN
ncbi:OmpA family protein [Corticibacterium sp. UT-5YL-CI-8]|nr:OmpA family protein [Tianweitania sp. UT-5YL-CI-8]